MGIDALSIADNRIKRINDVLNGRPDTAIGVERVAYKPCQSSHEILWQDFYNMACFVGTNVVVLHDKHPNVGEAKYVIVVDTTTGQGIRLTFGKEEA